MAEDFTVHTPGEPVTDPGTATVDVAAAVTAPPVDADPESPPVEPKGAKRARVSTAALEARIDELELALTQAQASERQLIEENLELKERLGDDDGIRREVLPVREAPLVGRDWRKHTSAEAMAAGVRETVLCSDGYYCPSPAAAG